VLNGKEVTNKTLTIPGNVLAFSGF
jgi:hypothetical protein